jgi:hypothetical protein
MIAYPDGTDTQVGDTVALAHGRHTGRVIHVIESQTDLDAWGLDEPGLMIDTSYGGLVFHPLYTLTGDEIAFVSRKANPPVPNHPDS